MNVVSRLFGAGKDRDFAPSLGELLSRLLEPAEEAESRRGKRGRRGGERPSLERTAAREWFDALREAKGELVALRISSAVPDLLLIGTEEGAADRESLAGIASSLAGLASREGPIEGLVMAEPAPSLARRWAGGGRKFIGRGGKLLIQCSEPLAQAIEARLKAEPGALEEYARGAAPALAPLSRIALDGGQGFALSRFFLPPFFPMGPAPADGAQQPEAAVFWDELALGGEPDPSSLWYAAQFGDPKLGLTLAFECPANRPDRAEYGAHILPILRYAWSRTAQGFERLAPAGSRARFGALDSAPSGILRGAARASGEVRLGSGGFPFALHVPPRFAAALARALESEGMPECLAGQGELAGMLALNDSLLMLREADYRDEFLRLRTPPGCERRAVAPPLAALLGSLGARDAAIVMQNCLMPHYTIKGLPYLFRYQAPFERNGKRVMRPVPLAPMRDADILRLLPAQAKEEWEQEKRCGLPQRALSASACVEANDEAARLVWEAARSGRIELSPDSFDLLEKLVGNPLESASRARLGAMAAQDLPFGFLATRDRRDAARIVDRLPNRELALASVGDGKHLDLLRASMGRGRRRDFREELEQVEKRLAWGELGVDEAIGAKLELLAKMRQIAEDLRKDVFFP